MEQESEFLSSVEGHMSRVEDQKSRVEGQKSRVRSRGSMAKSLGSPNKSRVFLKVRVLFNKNVGLSFPKANFLFFVATMVKKNCPYKNAHNTL